MKGMEESPQPVEAPAPHDEVRAVSNDIVSVTVNADGPEAVWAVGIKPSVSFSGSALMFDGADTAFKAARDLQKRKVFIASEQVVFNVIVPLADQYGNASEGPAVALRYDAAEIRRMNFDGGAFTAWDFMNLASSIDYPEKRAGTTIVREFCADGDNATEAAAFCARAITES
ncbi:hypothetical protein [Lysobacter sp. CA196]|uniref:hypothetical protein n=1 Tax=Lysobacter sp. CA196 TaxID=3455606 RepID=UPI003F8D04CE